MKTLSDIINGVNSIGLGEISDVGLPPSEWYIIPKCLISTPILKVEVESEETKAYIESIKEYVGSIKERDNTKAVAIKEDIIEFKDGGKLRLSNEEIKVEAAGKGLATIYAHYAKLDNEKRMIKSALNYVAITNGLVQLSKFDECTVVEDLADYNEEAKKNADTLADFIKENITKLLALLISTGINHWMSNHCLGSPDKSGLLEKVWFMCPFSKDIKEKGNVLKGTLYNLLHAVNKRNALYCIARDIVGLYGLFTPGTRKVKLIEADKAFTLRISSLPAGNKKVEIALALFKFANDNEIVTLSRSAIFFKDILILNKKVKEAGVLAHIGAFFYSFRTAKEGKYIDFVNSKVEEVIAEYGNMLLAIASAHTLAVSPIVLRAVESSVRKPIADLAKTVIKLRTESADEYVKKQAELIGQKKKIDDEIAEVSVAVSKFFEKTLRKDDESE